MHVPITQPTEDIAGDLVFTQPKFHFGQVLEDAKGARGFVYGMEMSDEWHYRLAYIDVFATSHPLPESTLAIATRDVSINIDKPALNWGS